MGRNRTGKVIGPDEFRDIVAANPESETHYEIVAETLTGIWRMLKPEFEEVGNAKEV